MEKKKTPKTKHNFFQRLNDKRKKLSLIVGVFIVTNMMTALTAFADTSGGGLSADTGKAQFSELINFFAVWMQRIGAVIALVGAGMFAFANKSEDPEGRQRGVNTMVSGIMVFAIFAAADWFIDLA